MSGQEKIILTLNVFVNKIIQILEYIPQNVLWTISQSFGHFN